MKKFTLGLISLALIAFSTLSCNIGLGAAVDTQPPEVKVERPEVGAVIRGSFAVAGQFSDDGTIKKPEDGGLTVVLERTDDSGTPATYTGSFDKDAGTWICEIDGTKLLDGEYQATITMVDTYEHSTVKTSTFTIDNTPPVVVLQRPAEKKGADSADSYGQTFTLQGQAADDNNVNSIDVYIYADDECTELLHTVTLNNVPPTIELDVAQFLEGIDNDYSKIYGTNTKKDATTKNFYCKIVAYDGAQKYPVDGSAQSAADKRGNSADYYYLYEEISASILNTYKITDVYHMNSGVWAAADSSRAATVSSVKETLSTHKIDTGYFSLNPANNPTFVVSGRNTLAKDGHDFDAKNIPDWEISNGTKVQVEISTGLDGIPLIGDTLGVYVIECDANGNPKAGASRIQIVSPLKDKDGNAVLTDEGAIAVRKSLIAKSGTSYKFTTLLDATKNPEMVFNKPYIFGVNGYDEKGNEITDFGKSYGYYFVSNAKAPKLELVTPSNGNSYYKKGSSIQVKGSTSADFSYPNISFVITKENGTQVTLKEYRSVDIETGKYPQSEIKTSQPNGKKHVEFDYTIPASEFVQTKSASYTLSVTASSGDDDTNTVLDRILMYDTDMPVIVIDDVNPTAEKYKVATSYTRENEYKKVGEVVQPLTETGDYLNGEVTVKVSITDAYDIVNITAPADGEPDLRPYIEVTDSSNNPQDFKLVGGSTGKKAIITTPAKQEFKIDTTTLSGTVKIRVHAWDRAGNEGVVTERTFKVDQGTDKPVILPDTPASMTLTFADKADLNDPSKNTEEINFLPAGSAMGIKLVDDDGIKSYEFKIGSVNSADDSNLSTPENGTSTPANSPKNVTYYYNLPTEGGDYMCQMTVFDVNNDSNVKKFWIMVTSAAPALTADNEPADKIITTATTNIESDAKTELKSTIHISSQLPPFKVKRWSIDSTGTDSAKTSLPDAATTADYPDSFKPVAGTKDQRVVYEFTDNKNHPGKLEINYYVDSTAPTIDAETISVPSVDATESNSYRFSASASDVAGTGETKVSGVKKIQYTFDSTKTPGKIETVNGVTSLSTVFAFTQSEDYGFNHAVEGPKTIYVRAIDAVGNIGAWVSKDFVYDTSKPSISVNKYTPKSGSATDIENKTFDIGKVFTLSGVAADNYGIKSIKITESKDGSAATEVTTFGEGTTSWTTPDLPTSSNLTSGVPKTGQYTYKVIVTDKADKTNETTVVVNIDTEAPTFTVDAPEANGVYYGTSTGFGGTVKDGSNTANQGAKALYYAITDSATAPAFGDAAWTEIPAVTTGTTQKNWELLVNLGTTKVAGGDNAGKIPEGTKYIHVYAEDKAGNRSAAAETVMFYVDQGVPAISDVKYEKDGSNSFDLTENETYYYNGGASNTTFKITGNVLESNELKTFTATVDSNSPVNITKPAASKDKQAWSYTVTGAAIDQSHKVVITAEDPVTRTSQTKKTFWFYNDTKDPEITITNPDTDVSGENALTGSGDDHKYTFRANVSDAGSGLPENKYKYLFSKTALVDKTAIIESAKQGTGWTEFEGQSFSIEKAFVSGTGTPADGKLTEGHWYLYIYAVDKVGHENAAKRDFWVDLNKPKLTTKVDAGTAEPYEQDHTYAFNTASDIKTGAFKVYYKAEDTHGMAATPVTVTVKKSDGTTLANTAYTVGAAESGFYPISLVNPVDDDYTFIITATDLAGKTTTVTRTIRRDTTGPVISVTSPDDFTQWQTSSTVKFNGTATDSTGTAAVYYVLNPASAPANPTAESLEASGTIWKKATNTSNWKFELENVPDGDTNIIYIVAKDTVGNVGSIVSGTLKVDATSPTLDETDIGMSGKSFLNGATKLSISGTYVEATSGVKSVKIKEGSNTWDATVTAASTSWAKEIDFGSTAGKLTNGNHTLTIEIEDNAGNSGKIQRSVTIDTNKPTAGTLSVETAKKYTENSRDWYNTSSIDIKLVNVADAKVDNYASGISAVEYQVVTTGVSASEATWISMTAQEDTTTYTGKVNCNVQGLNTINVRVKDNAGNVTNAGTKAVYIDTGYPIRPNNTQYWVDLADTATANAAVGYSDQLLTNKTKAVHVLMVVSDANAGGTLTSSGIKEIRYGDQKVTVTKSFTPNGGSETTVYDLTIAKDKVADGQCTITIEDNVGNTTEFSPFSFKIDTTEPTVSLGVVNDADTTTPSVTDINGSIEIEVTASDNFALADTNPYVLKYKVGGAAEPADWSSVTNTLTVNTSTTPWKATIDTTALTGYADNSNLYLYLVATDKAGNSSVAAKKTLFINQNSDRPVIKLTNLVKDSAGKYILKYGDNATLEGIVSDDDATSSAVVKQFIASGTVITPATLESKTGTTDLTASSGDFKFHPADGGDGLKEVYFYIKDNKDKEFYTTATEALSRAYYQFKTDTKADNNAKIEYKSDGNAPEISSVTLQAWKSTGTTDADKNGAASPLGTGCVAGGKTKRYVDLSVVAKDDNGITGVTVEVSNGSVKKYYRSNDKVTIDGVSTYTGTGAVASTANGSTSHTYVTSRIDLNDFTGIAANTTGNVTVKVYAYDGAGLKSNQESLFVVDREAGTISISEPTADITNSRDAVYGQRDLKVQGTPTGSDVSKIYFTVTKDSTQPTSGWNELTGQTMSAVVVFDKKTENATPNTTTAGLHTVQLREWLKSAYTQTIENGAITTYKKWNGTAWVDTTDTPEEVIFKDDTTKDLYVWFKVEDNCGNEGYSSRKLMVIPNGDKPTVELAYPLNKTVNNVSSAPALAGTIRVYGTAYAETSDPQGIYIQIDTAYNGTTFNENWKTAFDALVAGKQTGFTVEKFGKVNGVDQYGIRANGTQNWNLPINQANEFLPTGGATQRNMAIRIWGVGGSGKLSEPVIQALNIDPNAPKIGGDGTNDRKPLELVQLSSTNPITVSNRMTYDSTKDIWVKGQWYIQASVYDDNGIKSIKLDEGKGFDKIAIVDNATKQNKTTQAGTTILVEDNACGYTGKNNYDVYIPLPTVSGTANYTIEATENTDNNNSTAVNIKVNYDDVAPKIGIKGHESVNISEDVKQDNGFYHIQGYTSDASDDGSKVSDIMAIAFYFVRRGSANTRVYDPMWNNKFVAVQTGTTNTTGISYEYGMFWKSATVTRPNNTTITLSAADDNIHAGGFVQLGGKIYTIDSVSGTTVTLRTEAPKELTAAKFAYALVIDNFDHTESVDGRTKETDKTKYGYGYYKAGSNASQDDGDLMQEKYTNGKWEAWINSANIPDGPIEIHYVALDNAQNFSVGIIGNLSVSDYEAKTTIDVAANKALNSTSTALTTGANNLVRGYYYSYDANSKAYISNNAPRITGVLVGCDYDGDNNYSPDEITAKYVAEDTVLFSGTARTVAKDSAQKFIASTGADAGKSTGGVLKTIKGSTSVQLEIVGGNGNLYYQYSLDGTTYKEHSTIAAITSGTAGAFIKNTTALTFTRNTAEGLANDADYGASYYKSTQLHAITFSEAYIKTAITSNQDKYWFTFEIHDSTEETTLWTSSQYCELKLPLSIQVHDTIKPNTVFNDLYWNSAADNSVYKDVNGTLYGHVELKKDLESLANTSTMATTYGKDDDKVSGIVTFSGYAYDNKRLSSIKWGIKNALTGTIQQNWPEQYITAVEFKANDEGNMAWTATGSESIGLPYYYFRVYDDAEHGAYLGQNGHKVYWELTIDTSRVQAAGRSDNDALGVGKDLYVWVEATDSSNNSTTMNPTVKTDGTDAQNIRPNYKVDVVPYVTKVMTRLANKNTPDTTVYSRTAKGHYPIASNEGAITLSGYNLKTGNADVTIAATTVSGLRTAAYDYTVSDLKAINNMNDNDAHGDYDVSVTGLSESNKVKNMYNRQPNTSTNLTLNDDIYFDVWEIKNAAAPKVGKLKEPVMQINPKNDQIAFAFANGADSLSLPSATTSNNTYASTSSTIWQKNYADYGQINMVFDANGYAHSVSIGKDTEPNSGYAGRMQYIYSPWGGNGSTNMYNWNKQYTVALESVGIPSNTTVNGTRLTANLIDVDRFGKPALAVSKTTNSRTNPTVYMAYYDYDNDQIRFRYGTITQTNNRGENNWPNFNQIADSKTAASNNAIPSSTGATYANHAMFEANADFYSLLAGGNTGNTPSEFVALDVVSGAAVNNDVVVIVWYDGDELKYTYRSGTKDDTNASSSGVNNKWSQPVTIFTGAGEYCAIKVAPDNSIHIAAYDRQKANIVYCYMSAYNQAANKKTCVVDAYSQIGEYISIDVVRKTANGPIVPYITYYSDGLSGLPKVAYFPDGITSTTTLTDGADVTTNLFTGDWEVSLIPTSSSVNKDNMNIGVWKDSSTGVIKTSVKPSSGYTEPNITGATTSDVTWYGNGSSQFVLGYSITRGMTGFIEIAQMKN